MPESLEQLLARIGDPVDYFRNIDSPPFIFPVVASEFSNFRDEQIASRDAAMLTDQSHHMTEALVEGKDALALLSRLAPNSTKSFAPRQAKQFAPCSFDGHVIGDGIMFYLADGPLMLVGRAPLVNWVQYNAETSGLDVSVDKDDRSPSNPAGRAVRRRHFRFQVQGPRANAILERVNGGPLPEIKFFRIGEINIGGRRIKALRHGMAGEPGLELWGPYDLHEEVRAAIVEAGRDFGLRQMGSRAYATGAIESGWIPSPLQAIYSGDRMKPFREWLPASGYEGTCSIGGSFRPSTMDGYYLTPFDLGYGSFVKFDHDFVGREALLGMSTQPHKRKVTFHWNPDDVARILASLVHPDERPFKFLDIPIANYAASCFDEVTERSGRRVGLSMFTGYTHFTRSFLSVGVVDPAVENGQELLLTWGEENGGTRKPAVERHQQTQVRVTVCPAPYVQQAREHYAPGSSWRTRQ